MPPRLALVALTGEAAFVAANAVLPIVQGQDVLSGTISALALGRGGAAMSVAFVLHGGAIVVVGLLLRTRTARVALVTAGAATALLAVFPDGTALHVPLAALTFVALPVGFLVHAKASGDRTGLAMGAVAAAATGLFGLSLLLPGRPLLGLTERLAVGADVAWIVRAAWRALRKARRGKAGTPVR